MLPEHARLIHSLSSDSAPPEAVRNATPLIGVLEGTGVGPSVVESTLRVFRALQEVMDLPFEIRHGGPIGEDAIKQYGQWLPDETAAFYTEIFQRGGAILNGPGGGRYVYDLRRRFDLFCKFVPVRPVPELVNAGRIAARHLRDVDILIVRDNAGGVYQGRWSDSVTPEGRVADHSFSYREAEVRRLMGVAARAAQTRRGRCHVIVKDGGVPAVTALWRDVGTDVSRETGVDVQCMNVDLAAYELIQTPARFDVVVAPNLFGDIMADICGVLVSSRGVTFSGNFTEQGYGVYQTNHGCAHDLAGTDVANPCGQMYSLAMMLRESFGRFDAAALVEDAIRSVWRQGWRTADLAEPGCRIVGTGEITEKIVEQTYCLARTVA